MVLDLCLKRIRVSEDVLLDPDGLPHVLALAVPLLTFLAGWSEEIILGTQLLPSKS